MLKIDAETIKYANRSTHTPDGKFVIISLLKEDDTELNIAIPLPQVRTLIETSAKGMENCRKAAGLEPNETFRFRATQCEIALDEKDQEPVLTITFGDGAKVSFEFELAMARRLAQSLDMVTGRSIPPRFDRTAH